MKKFTAIALCFVLTAAVLTACRSKSPEETAGTTIMPTASATTGTTEPATMGTLPATIPDQGGTDATGGSGITDATGGSDSSSGRQGRNPMPMG